MTRTEAELLARQTALAREAKLRSNPQPAPAERKTDEPLSLRKVLRLYHEHHISTGRWGVRQGDDAPTSRNYWLHKLEPIGGPPLDPHDLTPADAEKAAAELARDNGWEPRTQSKHLNYLKAALGWAYKKKRLLTFNPLLGAEGPKSDADTSNLVYSREEVLKLVAPRDGIDWRVTLIANIAADTGRRVTQICRIWAGRDNDDTDSDIRVREGIGMEIRFVWWKDKAKKTTWVPVSEPTAILVAEALQRGVVKEFGWLLPGGRLDRNEKRRGPSLASTMIKKLHKVEALLGIPTIAKRAFHGIKRRHVTMAMDASKGDTDLVGDVTGNRDPRTIRSIYRQQNPSRQREHVRSIRDALEGVGP